MRILVLVEVGMGGFSIYFVPEGAVCFSVDVIVQEWEATFFYFHCKLYLVVESIEVVQKFCQMPWNYPEESIQASLDVIGKCGHL